MFYYMVASYIEELFDAKSQVEIFDDYVSARGYIRETNDFTLRIYSIDISHVESGADILSHTPYR